MTEIRRIAENYVKTQVKSWNGSAKKVSKGDINKAIAKVTRALTEAREASAKAAAR